MKGTKKLELPGSKFAFKHFGKFAERRDFQNLRAAIVSSRLNIMSSVYISTMILYLLLAGPLAFMLVLLFELLSGLTLISPLLDAFLVAATAEALTFSAFWGYPILKSRAIAADIEANLPFVLIHMQTIARSGAPPAALFKLVSEFKEYGEITEEFRRIVRNIETFGMSEINAIKDVILKTPSSTLKDLLSGMITTIQSGGKLSDYLSQRAEEIVFEYRLSRRQRADMLATYADIYTIILIAAPLILVIVLTIIGTIGGAVFGLPPQMLIQLCVYGFVPLLNIMFLAFLIMTERG